jgi:hypothetical protein
MIASGLSFLLKGEKNRNGGYLLLGDWLLLTLNPQAFFMQKVFPLAGAAALLAVSALPGLAIPENAREKVISARPSLVASTPLTARAVSDGFVRSNVLLPLGGTKPVDNPVPPDLTDLSGWTQDELEAGLQKEYDVDVAAVANFLYSDKGVEFLSESIQKDNYTPYYSQANSIQSVRSAIILAAADGKLSSYGMMAKLPVDQRLQGSMKVCDAQNLSNEQQETSLLSWYMNTPACIQAYTAVAEEAPVAQPVRGLW